MLELPDLKKIVFNYFTQYTAEKVRFMVSKFNTIVFGFAKAQLFVSLIIFAVTFVGLLLIKPQYAVVMSLLYGLSILFLFLGPLLFSHPGHFITSLVAMLQPDHN